MPNWDGRPLGYKPGHGTRARPPFVVAVEIDTAWHPRRMSPNRVKGFRSKEVARWGRAKLAAGTAVHSDGLACFAAVTTVGCVHAPTLMSGQRASPNLECRMGRCGGRCGAQGALPQRACRAANLRSNSQPSFALGRLVARRHSKDCGNPHSPLRARRLPRARSQI